MQIQLNVPDEPIPDTFSDFVERTVRDVLAPHEAKLTRIEIHIRDLNAQKGGVDKRCVIEARPRGLDPVAANHESTRIGDAFQGALQKLRRVLDHRFGRLASKGRGASPAD